ncbi:MAG: hypothetical protein IPK11_00915 [Ignavibacteria bacterium]|jgi:hypothetical protein|nr:hypothetical protein [Ignavibacteria bacterium]
MKNTTLRNKICTTNPSFSPYCCQSFSGLASTPGDSGFSVINVKILNKVCFIFQAKTNSNIKKNGGVLMEQVVKFCPFCGENLDKIICKKKDFFSEKAENDKIYETNFNDNFLNL